MPDTVYSVYILRCGDDSYYTGIAADVERRIAEHETSTRGAKYLKGRGPLSLVFSSAVGDRSAASKLEYSIKRLSRAEKQALISGSKSIHTLLDNQGAAAG